MDTVIENTDSEMSVEQFNSKLWDQISSAGDGMLKTASASSTNWVKRELRESAFAPLIIEFENITDDDLTKLPESELPVVIGEIEPETQGGAMTISFNDGPESTIFRGENFVIYFSKNTTPEFTKNINELRTWKYDLRGIVTDNAIKDLGTVRDGRLIKTVDKIVGSVGSVGEAGVAQNYQFAGGWTRANYKNIFRLITKRRLNNGTFLMNRDTAVEFLGWGRDQIGGDLAEKLLTDGLGALTQSKFMGVNHIFTMKSELVPDDVIYQFAEPGHLGRACVMQEPTMYVKKERDILRFSAEEIVGCTIANVAAVNRAKIVA